MEESAPSNQVEEKGEEEVPPRLETCASAASSQSQADRSVSELRASESVSSSSSSVTLASSSTASSTTSSRLEKARIMKERNWQSMQNLSVDREEGEGPITRRQQEQQLQPHRPALASPPLPSPAASSLPRPPPLDVSKFHESWSTPGASLDEGSPFAAMWGATAGPSPSLPSPFSFAGRTSRAAKTGAVPRAATVSNAPLHRSSHSPSQRQASSPAQQEASRGKAVPVGFAGAGGGLLSSSERPGRVGYRCSSGAASAASYSSASTAGGGGAGGGPASLPPYAGLSSPSHATSSSAPGVDSSGVSSIIHDAARIANWDHVLQLCGSHPEAAAYTSPTDGWTALHHACSRRCPYPQVVRALIDCYPKSLSIPDKDRWGWVPLHYACRFKAPKSVVDLLLHLHPDRGLKAVSRRDGMGRTPLFYAIRYDAPPGVVGLLLHVDPSAVLEEDQNADSPLALVWDSWAEKLEGKRVVNSFLPGGFPEPEDQTVEERARILRARLHRDAKLRRRWDKANMLLRAAFGFSVDDDSEEEEAGLGGGGAAAAAAAAAEPRKPAAAASSSFSSSSSSVSNSSPGDGMDPHRKWRIVHATAAVKCHLSLFLLACALHPEQVQEMDEFDLRRPGDAGAPDQNPRQTALHLAASSNSGGEPGKTVLLTLLSQYREAASIPDGIDESLPLHRMVENPKKKDWTNHAAILYRFYPRAVQIPDRNGKLPLHRAAAAVTGVDAAPAPSDEENVILQLLRVFPQAASHADHSGLLPLHSLAAHSSSWDSGIEAVYNIHRNAVLVRAGPKHHHRLPLHLAAASPSSREPLLSRLLLHHPRAASMPDGQGKLPLFLACEAGKSWEGGTRCLYAAHPGAAGLPEDSPRGWYPLHAASSAPTADADLLAHLVELHAEAASLPDFQGRYPLHLACLAGKSWTSGGISVLFDADPASMSAEDGRGRLPFHCAALVHCRARQRRVVGSPDFYEHEDRSDDEEGGCDDLALTEREREARKAEEAAHVDILFNLLRADPTVLEGAAAGLFADA